MGAGLAGLSCAICLERKGIQPIIFEKHHRVGERFPNVEAVIELMHRPIKNSLAYINKISGINLQPTSMIHTIEVNSPNKKALIKGSNIGYTTIRGHDMRSWECQLESQLKTKIHFEQQHDLKDLKNDFDYVVVATGDAIIPLNMGLWKSDIEPFLKGCIVKGNFNTGSIRIWFNQNLSKQGYVFFLPFDENEACLSVAAGPSSHEEIDKLWEKTVDYLNIDPLPNTTFKVEEMRIGKIRTRQLDNIIFIGNSGGFIEPFAGFGQITSIISGIQAAESIINGKNYNNLTKWYDKLYEDSLALRHSLNQFNNDDFDEIISLINMHQIQNFILNPSLSPISLAAKLLTSKEKFKNKL